MNTNYPREWAIKFFNDLDGLKRQELTDQHFGSDKWDFELTGEEIEQVWLKEIVFPWWESLSVHVQVVISERNGYIRQQVVKDESKLADVYMKEHIKL